MMRIINNRQWSWIFVPDGKEEEDTLNSIFEEVESGEKVIYKGRERDENEYIKIHLRVNDIKVILRGSTKNDKRIVGEIRDMYYFTYGKLFFLGETEVNGKRAASFVARKSDD